MLTSCYQVESTTTSVTVSWQPSYPGVSYEYSYNNSSKTTTTKTSVTVSGLTADTTYKFNVQPIVQHNNVRGNIVSCKAITCMLPSNINFCLFPVVEQYYSRPTVSTYTHTYRVFQKKTDPLICFCNNFGKCTPILIIFSLLQQENYGAQN